MFTAATQSTHNLQYMAYGLGFDLFCSWFFGVSLSLRFALSLATGIRDYRVLYLELDGNPYSTGTDPGASTVGFSSVTSMVYMK